MFYCNICFTALRPGDHATASTCGHIYCRCCFAKVLEQKQCHICSTSVEALAWKDHCIPAGIQNPQDQLLLIGYSLENCISLCLAGIQFKCRQDELYAKLRQDKVQQRMLQADNHYKKKIGSMNQGYAEMKQRVEMLQKEKQDMEADIAELRDKYGQKAKEAHSLRQQASGGRRPGTHSGGHAPNTTTRPLNSTGHRSVSPHHQAIARTLSTPVYANASPSALMRSSSPYNSNPVRVNRSDYAQKSSKMAPNGIYTYGQATFDSPIEMQGYTLLQQAPGQMQHPSPSITPAKRRIGMSPLQQCVPHRGAYSQPMMSHLGLPPPAPQG